MEISPPDNLTSQADEIEALTSIYGPEWRVEDVEHRSYSYTFKAGTDVLVLSVKLPQEYPSSQSPTFELTAPALSRFQKQEIALFLNDIYLSNLGEPIIYQWIEAVREYLQSGETTKIEETSPADTVVEDTSLPLEEIDCALDHNFFHGDLIQDRKSVFQGHAVAVQSEEDVKHFVEGLKRNKRILNATHNILAYRIKSKTGTVLQDCDDDGETHAGGRVLHLLQILDICNAAVVVTRWYGGKQLGPTRFKHINNAARQVLEKGGFIEKK